MSEKVGTIIVYAIDRLGKNTNDVLETVEALNVKGSGGAVAP